MNALAMLRGRRPASVQLEDQQPDDDQRALDATGLEIIGQELVPVTVPVVPLTPSAEGGDGFGASRGDQQQLALVSGGEDPRVLGGDPMALEGARGDDSGLLEGEASMALAVAATSVVPNGGETPQGRREMVLEYGGREVTPLTSKSGGRELVWPGGPTTAIPKSFGPVVSEAAPLFDYEQLRRFQELYEAAPGIYGRSEEVMMERPQFLREEEELQRRLLELQELRKRATEEAMRKQARIQQEQERVRQAAQGSNYMESEVFKQVVMENARLKEELHGLKKGKEEKSSPVREEFNTPDNIPLERTGLTSGMDVMKRLEMNPVGQVRAPLHHGGLGGDHTAGLHGRGGEGDPSTSDTMKFMMTMLESMQQLMKERESGKGDAEIVKTAVELPKLPEWSHETGPIDLGDWIATIDPFMEDLSDTAEIWWKLLRKEAMVWYEDHMAMSPLDRLTHEVVPSLEISKSRWSRLERRAAGLLMAAIPSSIREEVVSTRSVNAMGILTRLFTVYQPGGLAEKALILSSLENPKEESSVSGAVQSLRRWIRWRRRASDVGVSVPDPTVLMRGLTRLTKKVMSANPELAFRVSLARNTLLVDSIPNHKTVSQLADHILAELEQVQHQDRKRDAAGGDALKAKEIKALEQAADGGGKSKGKGKDKGEKGGKGERSNDALASGTEPRCKFFLSDQGCRKGKECTWAHVPDGKRRCYVCGATDHLAPECPRKTSTTSTPSPTRPKAARVAEEKPKEDEISVSSEGTSVGGNGGEVMQQLLSEANKMLKSLSTKDKPTTVTHDERMRALQEQLDELKSKALKTLRLTRITRGGMAGLLDSGATHPMRPARKDEPAHSYKKVEVTLASGKIEEMKISPKGVMVVECDDAQNVEPIVPMGMLVTKLRCQLHWSDEGLHVWHPKRGYLDISVQNGCPQISRSLALKLIQELEQVDNDLLQYNSKSLSWEARLQERAWLRSLVNSHPVFDGLPETLKDKLVVTPEENLKLLPANRRARKIWKRDGCVLHLYAGEASGYTFARAYKEAGGRGKQVLEIDVKRGDNHDMTKASCYGSLMRLALEGQIATLIGGPNCRTRSVLRTYEGGPPMVRDWNGGEFGSANILEEEKTKVQHDDEMMWKMILLYLVSKAAKKALNNKEKDINVGFLLEQPASPVYKPEVVSFWWTDQWRALQRMEDLRLINVNQGDYGGDAIKPTGLGTNLGVPSGRLRGNGKARPVGGSGDSSALARWAPGLMKAVATAVLVHLGGVPRLRAINWEQHLKGGHYPFHRDCRVCQEAAAKDRPHRRLRHPKAGVLSLDIAGPLRPEKDHEAKKKYILVGAFTWIVPRGEVAEEKLVEIPEGAPAIDADEILADEEGGRLPDPEVNTPDQEELHPGEELHHDHELPHGEDVEEKESQDEKKEGNGGEGDDEFDIEVYRLAIPIEDRSAEKVLDAVIRLYLELRADGFQIQQLHTDKAREFVAKGLVAWCRNRNIYKTSTSGDSPQQNGRAERAVQYVKGRIRVLLLSAGWKASSWPLACWNIHAMERLKRNQRKMDVPAFGTEVLVRKRYWKSKELEPTHEKVRYVAPIPEVHGHLVVEMDGALRVTAYAMAATKDPPENEETWIAIKTVVEDKEDEAEIRRRIRGKTAIRVLEVEVNEDDPNKWKDSLRRVIEDESVKLIEDEENVGVAVYRRLRSLKAVEAVETEAEEVLRTRIVSVAEFLRDAREWRPAIEAEMRQLFEEKKALVSTTMACLQELKSSGKEVDFIPSKLVITLKPGPRRKVRIVACGNYVEFKGEELYAAGADSAALRLLLKVASEGQWCLLTVDVKVAFLNAPLVTSRKDGTKEDQIFALKPPSLLLRLGYAKEDEVWVAEKAMYGLRQSPRSWSLHRDTTLNSMVVHGLRLRQTTSEPNLWVIEDDHYRMVGMMLVYVDDMLIGGRGDVANRVLRAVQGVWETSEPEKIDEGLMSKFLGMELTKENGVIKATQTAFIRERLAVNLGENWEALRGYSTPCGREIIEIEEEQEIRPEDVKEAQRIVGELLWLVTRSRLDLMYVTSRLAQWVLRAPKTVQKLSKQVWSYLRRTLHQGLLFLPDPGKGWAGESQKGLEAFSDASFAPGGQNSIGSVVILWNGAPMMWKAGKQPFLTMSAAESELTEATEAMLMGDAFDALLGDVAKDYPRSLLIDNQAAIQLMSEESGAWRTRHLRLRSRHLRWRISRMDWRVNHCPGEQMLADIGTKPLAAQRFDHLKDLCGMSGERRGDHLVEDSQVTTSTTTTVELQQALRMLTIATMMTTVTSQGLGEEGQVMSSSQDETTWRSYFLDVDYYKLVMGIILVAIVLGGMGVVGRIARGNSRRRMMAVMMMLNFRGVRAPEGDDQEDESHAKRDTDAMIWMMVAMYTMLVVIAVNVVQRAFGTWRNYGEMAAEEREEVRLTPAQRMRIKEAQTRLEEADEKKNQAEESLFRAVMDAYHPDYFTRRTPSRTPTRYTTPTPSGESRASGRRSRRDYEESSGSQRYELSRSEREDEEDRRRVGEESDDTRGYATRSEDERSMSRFNAFESTPAAEDVPQEDDAVQNEAAIQEDVAMQGDDVRQENRSPVILPEYQGPGRYVEDATRGLRRRLDRLQEEDAPEDHEGEVGVDPRHQDLHDSGDQELPGDIEDLLQDEELSVASENEVEIGFHIGPIGQAPEQEVLPQAGMEPDTEPGVGDSEEGGRDGGHGGEPLEHQGDDVPDPPLPPGDLPDHEVLITPNGTRYHLSVACPTLANTRRVLRSDFCEFCCRRDPAVRGALVHVVRRGETAHFDPHCPHVGLRLPELYPCCQMCPRRPTNP